MKVTIDRQYRLTTDAGLTVQLRPGAALLYRARSLVGWLIRTKTWSPVNHIEVLSTPGHAVSARAEGVRNFLVDTAELYEVWTPKEPFDLDSAMAWFAAHANGQRYDWLGLFRFYTLGQQSLDKQFCSEVCTRLYRAGSIEPFTTVTDADLVSPGMYRLTPAFERSIEASAFGW